MNHKAIIVIIGIIVIGLIIYYAFRADETVVAPTGEVPIRNEALVEGGSTVEIELE
ncbi:MAG: hypothetical protein AAB909_00200 [Patescibacteria group bacterium]